MHATYTAGVSQEDVLGEGINDSLLLCRAQDLGSVCGGVLGVKKRADVSDISTIVLARCWQRRWRQLCEPGGLHTSEQHTHCGFPVVKLHAD